MTKTKPEVLSEWMNSNCSHSYKQVVGASRFTESKKLGTNQLHTPGNQFMCLCVRDRERREACTVEPLNKGHCGNGHIVLFSEAVPISVACHFLTIASFNNV